MYYVGLAWLDPLPCKTLPQATGQLNLNMTLACELLKDFVRYLRGACEQCMSVYITLHAVQQVSNSTHVVYPLMPHHH